MLGGAKKGTFYLFAFEGGKGDILRAGTPKKVE
jgi:hypothetical protein